MTPTPQPGATPLTREVVREIGRLAAQWKYGDIGAYDFWMFAKHQIDRIATQNAKLRERLKGINRTGMEGYLDAVVQSELDARDRAAAAEARVKELEDERDQWKLSSVCREKEAEIVRLREEVSALNKERHELQMRAEAAEAVLRKAGRALTGSKHVTYEDLDEYLMGLEEQLAAVTRERDQLRNNPAWFP